MEAARYRVVFRGEVGLGFTPEEIRDNISRLTRWDAKKIELLLDSNHCVIKSDLDVAAAERMLTALNNTGIICQKERLPDAHPASASPAPAATIAVVGRAAIGSDDDADRKCPKCGIPREGGTSCPACGIIFAKFGQPRVASKPVITAKVVSTPAVALQRKASQRRDDPLARLEESHPLGYYLGKLLLALVITVFLRTLYQADLALLVILFLPLGFLLYLGALSAVTERSFGELLVEHRSLLPIPSAEHERHGATLPFATYGLILLHTFLYLGFQLQTPVEILQQKWFFLPLDSSVANLFLSALASLFFHSGTFAFFGGLFFLWILGSTLERRIGSVFLLVLYLFCGLFAAGVGVGIQRLIPGETLPVMGAGGALAGLLGIFAIRSRLRTMTFPLPFCGLDLFFTGSFYQVRWSALLIAVLFVLADLGTPAEAHAAGRGNLGFAILLGGFFSGLLAAYVLGLGNRAGEEEDETAGSQVFTANEGELRRRLAANPDNPDLLVQLARIIADVELTDEARQLYRRAIIARLSSKPKEAAEIYREFNLRHQEVFEPKLTLHLAALYLRLGDTGMAASLLSAVCEDKRTTPQELEKALYQYGVTISRLGQSDEAYMTMKRFSDAFPDSSLLPKLREVVYNAAQPEPG